MNTQLAAVPFVFILVASLLAGCSQSQSQSHYQSQYQGGQGKKKEIVHMADLPKTKITAPPGREIATLASGCFWCTEAIFTELKGIDKVESGYSGGPVPNPTYKQVCGGDTGHAEAVNVIFDPGIVTFKDLLRIFFTTHDPTTLNRQGADAGTQYRSAIFYHNEEQRKAADEVIREIEAEHIWPNKIVTEVTAFSNFYSAEDYHQSYYAQNPSQGYCQIIIAPKVAKFREKYRKKLKR